MKTYCPSTMTDSALTAELLRLARSAREATAQLVAHLAEFDARRLYLAAGYASLFTYCCEVLRLSESGAYNRIEAARAARRFPAMVEMLADGSLTLATARLLAPHLTAENVRDVLAAAAGQSKRAVEEIVARLSPKPHVASSVRKLPCRPPEPRPTVPAWAESDGSATAAAAIGDGDRAGTPASLVTPETRTAAVPPDAPMAVNALVPAMKALAPASIMALAPERYQVRFTMSAATHAKLRRAQDLLRHSLPDGDVGELFDRALTLLLDELARRKFAAVGQPRKRGDHGSKDRNDVDAGGRRDREVGTASRHIPADVQRGVWRRDGGRCAFIGWNGKRCDARGFLEFHHAQPYAAGGQATVQNVSLRCRAHNQYEAKLYFEEIRIAAT
jgi:hypothetical protein